LINPLNIVKWDECQHKGDESADSMGEMTLGTTSNLRQMSFGKSLLFFGLPLLLMMASFWVLIPAMDLMGVRLFITFLAALGGPFLLLVLLSLRFYRKEGNPWSWSALRERFRLQSMNRVDWLYAIALAAFLFGSNTLLAPTFDWIGNYITIPKYLIRMLDQDPNYFMEIPLKGNWWIPFGMLVFTLCNVFGEEFWWRGYILPRQELSFGKWTWLVHGLLWNAFHLFMPWDQIRLLPGSLALPFVAQIRKNTWPGILAHFAINIPALIAIVKNL
jgi:membrane protease YdiL (CAAX protease family)